MLVLERPVSGEFQMKSCVSFPHQKYGPVVGKIYWHSKNKTLPIPTSFQNLPQSRSKKRYKPIRSLLQRTEVHLISRLLIQSWLSPVAIPFCAHGSCLSWFYPWVSPPSDSLWYSHSVTGSRKVLQTVFPPAAPCSVIVCCYIYSSVGPCLQEGSMEFWLVVAQSGINIWQKQNQF